MSPRRDTVTAYRARARATEAQVDAAVAEVRAEEHEKWEAAKAAARAEEASRVRFTAAELAGVTHVRDRFGWHRVVKVNAQTVTVETAHSWTERIRIDRILETRTVNVS